MTVSLNGTHPSTNFTQYNTHSLFGHMQSMTTFNAFNSESSLTDFKDKLHFILSRSTFAGSGQYASHVAGDTLRTWDDMRYSVASLMNFNMFGIPHTGTDVCGSYESDLPDEEQAEVCARWMQLATFYPFARQHPDEAGKWEPSNLQGAWQTMAIASIKERYRFMDHMYQCLSAAYMDGATCIDPLFFHYPEAEGAFDDIEHTFIAGDAFKVSPVLHRSQTTRRRTRPSSPRAPGST